MSYQKYHIEKLRSASGRISCNEYKYTFIITSWGLKMLAIKLNIDTFVYWIIINN